MDTTQSPRDMPLGRGLAGKQPTQLAAAAAGAVFLLVGILGFVPGITTNVDDLSFIGHESEAELLGLFAVNILHNVVHLGFGVAGLIAARTWSWSRAFLVYGGVIYLVLWIYGLMIDLDTAANFVNLNTPDNWLHFGLGVGLIAVGLAMPRLRH
jgi:hypothetical protein